MRDPSNFWKTKSKRFSRDYNFRHYPLTIFLEAVSQCGAAPPSEGFINPPMSSESEDKNESNVPAELDWAIAPSHLRK